MSMDYPDPGDILAFAATYGGAIFLPLDAYTALVSDPAWRGKLVYSNPADGVVRPLVQGVKVGFVPNNYVDVERLVDALRPAAPGTVRLQFRYPDGLVREETVTPEVAAAFFARMR